MIYKYFYFNVNICIYLFNFINENVEEPLGGAVLVFFLELNQNENPAV